MRQRDYQSDAVEACLAAYDAGTRRQLLVMATGTGKTHCFGQLYTKMVKSRLPGQMLVLAHTDELVRQNALRMEQMHGAEMVTMEMGKHEANPQMPIISASIQTLGRKGTTRLDKFNWNNIDKIIVDEAHHSTTDAYKRILDRSGCLSPESRKLLLGVTATPQRTDGVALDSLYEKVVYLYPLRKAIQDGWLVDIRGYCVRTTTSLEGLSKTDGDFSRSELSERVNSPQRNQQIVDAWARVGERRKTVVYCVDIEHAQAVAEEFRGTGISADAMWGEDPERVEKLQRHVHGQTVLCVCGLLIEGYDDPSISCIILARPTQSAVLLPQMVGRGTRLEDGVNLLGHSSLDTVKRNVIVIYFVDGNPAPSLITLPTLMGLSNNLDTNGKSILEAAVAVEKLQEENLNVDFSKLDSLAGAKTLIEQVDMFRVNFPQEVKDNSELIWYKSVTGGYKMLIPKEGPERQGFVHIQENLLGQWELKGEIKGDEFHGIRPSFEEAIKVTDEQIRKRVSKQTLSYIVREAKWHSNPCTRGQKKMLTMLFPWKKFDFSQIKSGEASKKITETIMLRRKK
jgi:ATP-dependent helicase IRC3